MAANPVTYTIDVFLNGKKLINTFTGTVGFLQTSRPLAVPVPSSVGKAGLIAKRPLHSTIVGEPKTSAVAHGKPTRAGR